MGMLCSAPERPDERTKPRNAFSETTVAPPGVSLWNEREEAREEKTPIAKPLVPLVPLVPHVPEVPEPPPPPVLISEALMLEKLADERDIILDDGETVAGRTLKAELTQKQTNKQITEMGCETKRLDTREPGDTAGSPGSPGRPVLQPGTLWVDPDFSREVAMDGVSAKVQWLRPKEFLTAPCLYSAGASRYDVDQGLAGTCWFLSVLQGLAEMPEYFSQIIPEGAYVADGEGYDGVFHCRFWSFGTWVDVYIDDFIPVFNGCPWGAHSMEDPNELWVTLMEKAFAKFHGSYSCVDGGQASEAFSSLTGGTSDILNLEALEPRLFVKRIKNALSSGSIIATSILGNCETNGLIGKHSYAITAICKVVYGNTYLPLVQIRNPWGGVTGLWTGAWSVAAQEWNKVSTEDKRIIHETNSVDGEFWMSLTDYFQYFGNVTICNFIPDVDQDGTTDGMDKVWIISGQWNKESAVGHKAKFNNPKYQFEIPTKGVAKSGTPLAIQFMQKVKDLDTKKDLLHLRADLYKIENEAEGGLATACLLRELTSDTSYWVDVAVMYRYPVLDPGKYLIVPHYLDDPGNEKDFLLRLFSRCRIKSCRAVTESRAYYVTTFDSEFKHGDRVHKTPEVYHDNARWAADQNAGGQISHQSVSTNPQYQFRIADSLPLQPCSVSVCQDLTQATIPLGFRLFKRNDNNKTPVDTAWLYENYEASPRNTAGQQHTFVSADEVQADYLLPSGEYLLLLHSNEVNETGSYFLQIATKHKVSYTAYHICK